MVLHDWGRLEGHNLFIKKFFQLLAADVVLVHLWGDQLGNCGNVKQWPQLTVKFEKLWVQGRCNWFIIGVVLSRRQEMDRSWKGKAMLTYASR